MSEVCLHHDTHDGDGEPTGPPCGEPATHMIVWLDGTRRYSPCCEPHSTDVDAEAPPHEVRPLC